MKHTYSFFSNRVPKTTTNYYFGNYNFGGQGGYVFARVQLYDIYYTCAANTCTNTYKYNIFMYILYMYVFA